MKKQTERRLFPRLRFRARALVVADTVVGLVKDVSLGGLCFAYYPKDGVFSGGRPLDLVTGGTVFTFFPEDYALVPSSGAEEGGADGAVMMECRLRFRHVSATQLAGLWALMKQECAVAEVFDGGRLVDFERIEAFVAVGRRTVSAGGDRVMAPENGVRIPLEPNRCRQKETEGAW